MKEIGHWSGTGVINIAESAHGVLATCDPLGNVVRGGVNPWPAPELIQKLYASEKWRGNTEVDDKAARASLGHYCDLQSLNSEDAITWSFFGPLIYGQPVWREAFAAHLFKRLNFPKPGAVAIWLWRRIPHPEKVASTGGPEIDFGICSDECVVLGEAKWNSKLGTGQGINGNRTQLDHRLAYCAGLGPKAIPAIRHWAVLGVGRRADVLDTNAGCETIIHNLSWSELVTWMPEDLQPELTEYLVWKDKYSIRR